MRNYSRPLSRPIICIAATCASALLLARYGGEGIAPSLPFFASCLCLAAAVFCSRRPRLCSGLLLGAVFFLAATDGLVQFQTDRQQAAPQVVTSASLSRLDRALLTLQDWRQAAGSEFREQGISGQAYAVLSAMILGDKSALSSETRNVFSVSGASHILAVSGLHIGILFQLTLLLLGGRRHKALATVLAIPAIWMYTLFIGLPASAVRSASMLTLYSIGWVMQRGGQSIVPLCWAATVMMLLRPAWLWDVGFQLSFASVLSILLLMPGMQRGYRSYTRRIPCAWLRRPAEGVCASVCMSLAALLGTSPLVLHVFHRFSTYAILTNFVAIPGAFAVVYLGVFTLCLHPLPLMQSWMAGILDGSIRCLASLLGSLASLPGASVEGVETNIPQLCFLYGSIVAGVLAIRKLHQSRSHQRHLSALHRDCISRVNQISPQDCSPGHCPHTLSS